VRNKFFPFAYDTVVAVVSDLHAGGTTALCPPAVTMNEGGTYRQSKLQGWLWVNYLAYWDMIDELLAAPETQPRFIMVLLGDLIEGLHHKRTQLWTTNLNTQGKAAEEALQEGYKRNPDHMFFVRGTATHVGDEGLMEEAIAQNFGAVGPREGVYSWYHLQLDINSIISDYLHHGSGSGREWTKANPVNNQAADLGLNYFERGEKPPDVAFRAHVHQKGDSYDNFKIRVISLPSWQLSTEFGHKIGRGKQLPIGSVALLIGDSIYDVESYYRWSPGVEPWKIESKDTSGNMGLMVKKFSGFWKKQRENPPNRQGE